MEYEPTSNQDTQKQKAMRKQKTQSKVVIGRFFKTEASLIAHLEKQRKDMEAEGIIIADDFYERFKVMAGKNGLLLFRK